MDRRDALKKLGMGGATVIGATAVLSSPAFADSGSPNCFYSYDTAATATVIITRPSNNNASFAVTTTPPSGTCGCGTPVVTWQYYGALNGVLPPTPPPAGWTTATSYASGVYNSGGGASSNPYNVQVGVRIQCGTSFICRFLTVSGSGTGGVQNPPENLTTTSSANLIGC